ANRSTSARRAREWRLSCPCLNGRFLRRRHRPAKSDELIPPEPPDEVLSLRQRGIERGGVRRAVSAVAHGGKRGERLADAGPQCRRAVHVASGSLTAGALAKAAARTIAR